MNPRMTCQTLTHSNYFSNILGLETAFCKPLFQCFYTHVDFKGNLIYMFLIHLGLTQHNCSVRITLGPRIFLNLFCYKPLKWFLSNQEACFLQNKLNSNPKKDSNVVQNSESFYSEGDWQVYKQLLTSSRMFGGGIKKMESCEQDVVIIEGDILFT
jgi:hypothetical protein